jgi:hypothetical protein
MQVDATVAVGLLTWAGATLLIDARWRRCRRPDLADRLLPYQPVSVADEAQRWLEETGPTPERWRSVV